MSSLKESEGSCGRKTDDGGEDLSLKRDTLEKDKNGADAPTTISKDPVQDHDVDKDVPAVLQKKLDEPEDERANSPEATKTSKCPFMAPLSKQASPFLTSKRIGHDDRKENAVAPDNEADSEVEKATAKKQHEKIDEMIKDRSIFSTIAKVYFKDPKSNKLENRGEGKFAIVKDSAGLYKILMIRDKVMLLGCNHYIAKSCQLVEATRVPLSWIWIALNDKSDAEVNEPKTTYFATFRTKEDFDLFEQKYNEAGEANAKTALELGNKEAKREVL